MVPYFLAAEWSELHQGDLASVSRVNSTFQALAAPHLYTTVVTDDFPLLLAGISSRGVFAGGFRSPPTPPPSARSTGPIFSKPELLRHTKKLRLAYNGPVSKPALSINRLLARSGDYEWSRIGETEQERDARMYKESREYVSDLMVSLLFIGIPAMRPPNGVMPNLDYAVIAREDTTKKPCWDVYDEIAADEDNKGLSSYQQVFTQAILACRPKAICCHALHGPYRFSSVELPSGLNDLVVTTHLHDEYRHPEVLLGATNRVIIEPTIDYLRKNIIEEAVAKPFLELALHQYQLPDMPYDPTRKERRTVENTSIEFYGLCRLPGVYTQGKEQLMAPYSVLERSDLTAAQNQDRDFMRMFDEWQLLKRKEEEFIQSLENSAIPDLPRVWRDKFHLEAREVAPCCDSCQGLVSVPYRASRGYGRAAHESEYEGDSGEDEAYNDDDEDSEAFWDYIGNLGEGEYHYNGDGTVAYGGYDGYGGYCGPLPDDY